MLRDTTSAQTRALDELRSKTLCDIHRETAVTWAWRGWAAAYLGHHDDFIEFRHECFEHSSLAGDGFATLQLVRRIVAGLETDELSFQAALNELRSKSLAEIQQETAFTWAWRAWAAYQLKRIVDAVDLEAEAIEHAALSNDDDVLTQVREIVRS